MRALYTLSRGDNKNKAGKHGLKPQLPSHPSHVTLGGATSHFIHTYFTLWFFPQDFYLFLERGEGKEEERERNINVWLFLTCPLLGTWSPTQAHALTGNQTGNPLFHRPALNPLSYTIQGLCFFS